jgi:hypothetical protein
MHNSTLRIHQRQVLEAGSMNGLRLDLKRTGSRRAEVDRRAELGRIQHHLRISDQLLGSALQAPDQIPVGLNLKANHAWLERGDSEAGLLHGLGPRPLSLQTIVGDLHPSNLSAKHIVDRDGQHIGAGVDIQIPLAEDNGCLAGGNSQIHAAPGT